jgi:DNA-binding IclR family transcriptional regulator
VSANEPSALREEFLGRFRSMERRLEELETIRGAGDADRTLTLAEVATRLRRKPSTLHRWLKDHELGARFCVGLLLRKPGGRWESTPRMLAIWQTSMAARVREASARRSA